MKESILASRSSALLFTTLLLAAPAPAATTLTTLYSFAAPSLNNGGYNPYAGLVEGSDGNFYGTAYLAGGLDGSVYRIDRNGGFTTLHVFTGTFGGGDGANPYAGLVQGRDGYLYGTTIGGGRGGNGTVFRISPDGSSFATLFSFTGGQGAQLYGGRPYGGLVQGSDGNFYGTTSIGGNGGGSIFRITPEGVLTTLHSLSISEGTGSHAALVEGSDGNFYGTTTAGGAAAGGSNPGVGTVFRISADGSFTTLHSFTGPDGNGPYGGLVQGTDGLFYGTTWFGGSNPGIDCSTCGNVFRISSTGDFTNLHSFHNAYVDPPDGDGPYNTLVEGSDGNFYGTTFGGGTSNGGTIFRITPSGRLQTLYSFGGSDGEYPFCAVVQGSDGDFYGTTRDGGANNVGTVFRLHVDAGIPDICIGDCDGNGRVDVSELIKLVNVALGKAASACPAGVPSGTAVNISLLVRAVNNALSGCMA